jgi:hypothetical protein
MRHHAMTLLMIGALGSACATTEDGDDVACADGAACATTAAARRPSPPQQIQAGDDLVLLAVTDDDHALYQDGQTVYATHLRAGAPRTVVAEVPGTNLAFPLQVGRVVFLWTDPQRNRPGFGVSPLVLWTAADGPRQISAQSSVGLGRHRRQPRQPRAGLHDQRHRRWRAWRSGLRPDRDRDRADLAPARHPDGLPQRPVSAPGRLRRRSRPHLPGGRLLRRRRRDRDAVALGPRRPARSDRRHRDAAAVHPRGRPARHHLPGQPGR